MADPACNYRIIRKDYDPAQNSGISYEREGELAFLKETEGSYRIELTFFADVYFDDKYRDSNKDDTGKIDEDEGASAVFAYDVRKFPDVS